MEHWLADGQLDILNDFSDSHCAIAVSGFGAGRFFEVVRMAFVLFFGLKILMHRLI